jgi:hypothetical protein
VTGRTGRPAIEVSERTVDLLAINIWRPYYRHVNNFPSEIRLAPPVRSRLSPNATGVLLTMLVALLFYLGWILPRPGQSLAGPTVICLIIGGSATLIGWLCFRQVFLAVSMLIVSLSAATWTIELSLPLQIWSSTATIQAQLAVHDLHSSSHHSTPSAKGNCSDHATGHIGPLDAPYRQCAYDSGGARFVVFTSLPLAEWGLEYSTSSALPDECSRHLTGPWWMFSQPHHPGNGCPIGYSLQGAA